MSISRVLSELALETPNSSIPEANYDSAVRMVLDTLACAYAGSHAPGIDTLLGLERELGARGDGTVFFSNEKLALPSAVYCNSAMIHAMDFDNNYPGVDLHILSIVLPIAMACAEGTGKSGRDFLSAVILGVEVAARIAKPYIKAKRRHSYFLTTSLVGGWGGVATAARLFSLSTTQTIHAIGIYYAHASGNRQALLEKSLTKRIQPAIAAKSAIYSVLLAKEGFTGPENVFEGDGGFYHCYTLDPSPKTESFRVPPAPFCINELVIKKYPTCGIQHASIESALYLKHKYNLKYEEIERVEFFLLEGGGTLVSMPFDRDSIPQIAAQFCAPYAIALALCKGDANVQRFTNEAVIQDSETMNLAMRTQESTSFDDMKLKNYSTAKFDCTYLKVYLSNNEILEHECSNATLGGILTGDIPLVRNKLFQCMAVYGTACSESVDQIIVTVKNLYEASSIEDLTGILRLENRKKSA